MLMECQQVETCYIGREQYKNALNRTMDLTANPSLGSAGLLGNLYLKETIGAVQCVRYFEEVPLYFYLHSGLCKKSIKTSLGQHLSMPSMTNVPTPEGPHRPRTQANELAPSGCLAARTKFQAPRTETYIMRML